MSPRKCQRFGPELPAEDKLDFFLQGYGSPCEDEAQMQTPEQLIAWASKHAVHWVAAVWMFPDNLRPLVVVAAPGGKQRRYWLAPTNDQAGWAEAQRVGDEIANRP